MIIQRRGGELLAVAQPDHARLAGIFAEVRQDLPWSSLVAAAHHHDDGWIAWEQAPTVDGEGCPHDFLTIPMNERVAIYRRGVDLLVATDVRAALLTSLHFTHLLAEGLGPLSGEARGIAESFLAEQGSWQARARRELGEPDAEAIERDHRVLRAMDYLSVLLCLRPLSQLDGTSVEGTTMSVEDRRVSLDPYPFEIDNLAVSVPAQVLAAALFESDEAYRSALAAAPVEELRFTLSRPRH